MKRSTSFHLEEDILDEIDEYKNKHKLSSRNAALERMLLERRNLLMVINGFGNLKGVNSNFETEAKNEEDDLFKKSMFNSYSDMAD